MYVFEILRTTEGDRKTLKYIKEAHKNSVTFDDGTTNGKSMLQEVNEWIPIEGHDPDEEVIALGYQDEILIGYIDTEELTCENECHVLEDVTHWRPKPFSIKEREKFLNDL